ncbi:MAG TPA: ATP-binding protein [Anaerolineae bacterium]|nr:ATP-binding protein [Anaerolineae bacterium]
MSNMWRSLRVRIIAWSFVPTACILLAVALLSFFAYQQVTEELVIARDLQVTRLSAGQLTASLQDYIDRLVNFVRAADSPIVEEQQAALAAERNQLVVFDGGVVILDVFGRVIASEPERPEIMGESWADRAYFSRMLRSRSPETQISDIVADGVNGQEVIVIAEPIIGRENEFLGAAVGMFRINERTTSSFYAGIIRQRLKEEGGLVYIVDGEGRVIYHSDVQVIGDDFSERAEVVAVLEQATNAERVVNVDGEDVVISYAPIPDTAWGLVIETSWARVTNQSVVYGRFLVMMLILGVVLPAVVVGIGVQRIMNPIQELIIASQAVAGGEFGHKVTINSQDELATLAHRFNQMSEQLRISYATLEQRVEMRTQELGALNEVARVVGRSLDLNEVLDDALRLILRILEVDGGGIYLLNIEDEVLDLAVIQGVVVPFADELQVVEKSDPGVSGLAMRMREAVALPIDVYDNMFQASLLGLGVKSLAAAPLLFQSRVLGVITICARHKRVLRDGELDLFMGMARQVAVAVANAQLYKDAQVEIRERRRTQVALQEAVKAAESANLAKSAFLASMSHELRTPLNAILGFAQLMMKGGDLAPNHQENLRIINRSGEHLLALINDVLEMSKIEAGRTQLQMSSFDLYRFIDDIEEMFRLRVINKDVQMEVRREFDVPQYVHTDERKLRQVLINLLNNAVKFTEKGSILLWVGYEQVRERAKLLFQVEDTGAGIPQQELKQVFEPFIQTKVGQDSLEGTGLGLPISQQFVKLMGGQIEVNSQVGKGSIFRFMIDVELAEHDEVEVVSEGPQVVGIVPGQKEYRLLIVEDNEMNQWLLVNLLEPLGFEVRTAVNGQEGIDIWREWRPDLIWMDMRMPVMDGYEATRYIKMNGEEAAPVIVAITASAFEEEREAILNDGCDDFVRKPFKDAEIYQMLNKHLGVEFVYETEEEAEQKQRDDKPELDESIAQSWIDAVREAAIALDMHEMSNLFQQMMSDAPETAIYLNQLANAFEYDTILQYLDQLEQGE